MKETVYLIRIKDNENDADLCARLQDFIADNDLFSFVEDRDMVAVKTHFGEEKVNGFVRPVYFQMMGEELKKKGGKPFITETSTLYRGSRSDAIVHMELAYDHGFTYEATGLPIIMADGLLGDEELEVPIDGQHYKSVKIATLIVKSQAMVVVSHFTGHLATGFGATIKNLGMGCSSRKGKMLQHSTAKPSIRNKKCTGCGECAKWCPADAITLQDNVAVIDRKKCIGCGECLAVCRFDAVGYNWSQTYEHLQEKTLEHAMGVVNTKKDKIVYFNFLTRISRDCDCMGKFEQIVPDIGVVVGFDPVAVDMASLDLVEKAAGKTLSSMAYDIPYKVQIEHAQKLGFGNPDYELIEK